MMGHDEKKSICDHIKTTHIIHKGVKTNPLKNHCNNETISSVQKWTAHSFLLIKDRLILRSKSTCGHAVYTIKFEGGASIIITI